MALQRFLSDFPYRFELPAFTSIDDVAQYLNLSSTQKSALLLASLTGVAGFLLRELVSYFRQDVRKLNGPPRSEASCLFGHELDTWKGEVTEAYSKWTEKYGSFIKIKAAFGHSDIIVATDHGAVRHIFANTLNYVKSPHVRPVIKILVGTGINWAEGADHANLRRVLTPCFTAENVQKMDEAIIDCAEYLEQNLVNLVLSNGGEIKDDITMHTSSCTLDIIGKVGFDYDFKRGSSPEAQAILNEWKRSITAGAQKSAFIANLFLRTFPFIAYLPNKDFYKMGEIKRITIDLASSIYERNEAAIRSGFNDKEHGFEGKDLMGLLMLANKREKGGLSKDRILNNICTLLMVGHETTAITIGFILYELARNKIAQSKLRDEVLKSGQNKLTYESVNKLIYLDAVVKEGLRLNAAGAHTQRMALHDDVIPLAEPIKTSRGEVLRSVRIRKGQVFHVSLQTMNRRRSVWGEDADAFKPERWIEVGGVPPPSELPHGWSSTVAFLDGTRNCIGYRLALLEMKIIVATLIRSIEFHDTGAKILQKFSATLQPAVDDKIGVLPLKLTLVSA